MRLSIALRYFGRLQLPRSPFRSCSRQPAAASSDNSALRPPCYLFERRARQRPACSVNLGSEQTQTFTTNIFMGTTRGPLQPATIARVGAEAINHTTHHMRRRRLAVTTVTKVQQSRESRIAKALRQSRACCASYTALPHSSSQGQATFLLLASYLFIVAKAVPPSYQLSHPFIYPWMYFLPAYDSNYTSDPCCYGPDTPMTDNPEGELCAPAFPDMPASTMGAPVSKGAVEPASPGRFCQHIREIVTMQTTPQGTSWNRHSPTLHTASHTARKSAAGGHDIARLCPRCQNMLATCSARGSPLPPALLICKIVHKKMFVRFKGYDPSPKRL